MTRASLPVYSAIAGFITVGLACLFAREFRPPQAAPHRLAEPLAAVARITLPVVEIIASPAAVQREGDERYYEKLRGTVRWVQTRLGDGRLLTPAYDSRLLLAKSAAQRAGLADVGLSWRDVYGIISAETSWVPRLGQSKDGTPNLGVAQFEPATARALGLRNPNDLVEAVHVAARHMKEAALWSGERIAGLKLGAGERAMKLREGVSIYYNLSSRGRAAWNGRNTGQLPVETRRHIANARVGAQEAALLDAQLQAMAYRGSATQAVAFAAGSATR